MSFELPAIVLILSGRRAVLRAFRDSDVEVVQEAATDPLIPLITTVPRAATSDAALAYIHRQRRRLVDGEGFSFVITDAGRDRAVGQIGLWLKNLQFGRVSIGYWVAPSARRQGYAHEALALIAEWGLQIPAVHRLELYVEPWNDGSWRAAERAGFQREGLLRSWEHVGDERRDMFMYFRLTPTGYSSPVAP